MNYIAKICLLFVVIMPSISFAQQNVFVVDIEAAALRSDYAKSFLKAATKSDNYAKGIAEYNKLRSEFKALEDDAKANGLTWSDEQKKTFNENFDKKVKQVNQLGSQLESARSSLQGRVIQQLTPDIENIVKDIIEEKKIDLLMNARAVFFQKPEFNITSELTKKLNEIKPPQKQSDENN